MAAVTMGFGDPLSPLQSVNRLLNFFFSVRIPNGKDCYPSFTVAIATVPAFFPNQRMHIL